MRRFKSGQEVVCVNVSPIDPTVQNDGLRLNTVYTVSGYAPEFAFNEVGVILVEHKSRHNRYGAYRESRFEPLVSDAILERELESVPEPFTA